MDKLTDEEIFLRAIKLSGKVPHENHTGRQQGIFVGVTVGAIMVRDNLSLKEAEKQAHELRERLHPKWLKGELKEAESVH